MKRLLELDVNLEKDYTLLVKLNEDGEILNSPQPFVVAYKFNRQTSDWSQGHYFHNLKSAMDFLYE